jgi:DNA repair and recombination protein RAD54B
VIFAIKSLNSASHQIQKRQKADLAALEEWSHIDCLLPSAQEYIRDAILQRLLPSPESAKQQDMDSDSDDGSVIGEALEVSDVQGGAMTFLFQRKAKSEES